MIFKNNEIIFKYSYYKIFSFNKYLKKITLLNTVGLITDKCNLLVKSVSNGFLAINFVKPEGGVI